MRDLTLWVAMFTWMMTPSLAAQATPAAPLPGALAPGKPAGVHQAQLSNPDTMTFLGLGVLVIGAGVYMASGHYKIPGSSSATGTSP